MKNLFDYATKELSQDAFLRWLFESYDCDEAVSKCAIKLLRAFSDDDSLQIEKIENLKTYAQWKKVDVLVTFKHEDKIFCIAIEDKTFTSDHDDQLKKYNDELTGYCEGLKGEDNCQNVISKVIYYKTSPVCVEERNRIEINDGWKVFDINQIYELFNSCISTDSEILCSYIAYIAKVHNACHNKNKPDSNEGNIDFLKWEAYFKNTIIPKLSRKNYDVGVWKAGQYPYICLVIKKTDISKKIPYLEIRSRDCLNNNFTARILLYEVDRTEEQLENLRANIKASKFKIQNYKQQAGISPENETAKTDEDFISLVEEYASEYLNGMKDW